MAIIAFVSSILVLGAVGASCSQAQEGTVRWEIKSAWTPSRAMPRYRVVFQIEGIKEDIRSIKWNWNRNTILPDSVWGAKPDGDRSSFYDVSVIPMNGTLKQYGFVAAWKGGVPSRPRWGQVVVNDMKIKIQIKNYAEVQPFFDRSPGCNEVGPSPSDTPWSTPVKTPTATMTPNTSPKTTEEPRHTPTPTRTPVATPEDTNEPWITPMPSPMPVSSLEPSGEPWSTSTPITTPASSREPSEEPSSTEGPLSFPTPVSSPEFTAEPRFTPAPSQTAPPSPCPQVSRKPRFTPEPPPAASPLSSPQVSGSPCSPSQNRSSEFVIQLAFGANMSESYKAVFLEAADRWMKIIVGRLPRIHSNFDVLISAEVTPIDGPYGILGKAGPTVTRGGGSHFLPLEGLMMFDEDDFIRMAESPTGLLDVVTHELGHTLGFGTLWQFGTNKLIDYNGTGTFPMFKGPQAIKEYNKLLQVLKRDTEVGVPVEGSAAGVGTGFSHWRQSIFDSELMTGFINVHHGRRLPLSRVTVAAMGDLGYKVDLSQADAFSADSLNFLSTKPNARGDVSIFCDYPELGHHNCSILRPTIAVLDQLREVLPRPVPHSGSYVYTSR